MILRHITRQQGRALLRANTRTSAWRRFYASETGLPRSGEGLSDQSQLEKQALEAVVQASRSPVIESSTVEDQFDAERERVAQKYRLLEHQSQTMGRYGTIVPKHYNPNDVIINPPRPSDLTPELLLASQSHLGHATSLWDPRNSQYIYGVRDGIHIIALEETLTHLRRACRVVEGVAERGGLILFVGTRKNQEQSVVQAAKLAGGYHLFEKWIPGSITNGNQILGPARKILVDIHDKEISVSEQTMNQLPSVKPDLVVCLNPQENRVLLSECSQLSIPTIGVIDTDTNPTWVTYPIPANDDSIRCTNVIAGVLGRAGQTGQASRKKLAAEGRALYDPVRLPPNFVLGEQYMTEFQQEGVPAEYRDADGRQMTQEEIEKLHEKGVIVDDSLMRIYNDGDGGNRYADVVYTFTEDGGPVPIPTLYGGAEPGPTSNPSPSAGVSTPEADALQAKITEMTPGAAAIANEQPGDPRADVDVGSSAVDDALARFEAISQATLDLRHEHSTSRVESAEREIATLRDELAELTARPDETLGREAEALEDVERTTADPDKPPVEQPEVTNDATEQLELMEERDRIEATKSKPDDKHQAKLDEENKKRSD